MNFETKKKTEDIAFKWSFKIKARKLIKIVKANEGLDESFINALMENCPSTAKFIELFVLVGAHK